MIPNDLAARLRLLTESVVNPVSAVREISAELPELAVGQRFTARIESALPDGSFRALVAGRSLTLALPQPAQAGDTLDLVVTARTPKAILAESAEAAAGRAPMLSRTAQLIGALLGREGQPPQPALIGRAAPLLPAPPLQTAPLASALQQAIAESGLFYEAHQAQWIAGRYPAEALVREPQARLAAGAQAGTAALPQAAAHEAAAAEHAQGASATAAAGGRAAAAGASALPAELQTIVLQQLDAAATQHIVWRGEVWPGQQMHWEIEAERERERNRESGEEAAAKWTTTLALALPRLGQVNVVLALTPGKVSLAMTANAAGAAALRQGLGDLADAFAAAGLPPLAAGVKAHESA